MIARFRSVVGFRVVLVLSLAGVGHVSAQTNYTASASTRLILASNPLNELGETGSNLASVAVMDERNSTVGMVNNAIVNHDSLNLNSRLSWPVAFNNTYPSNTYILEAEAELPSSTYLDPEDRPAHTWYRIMELP